MPRTAKGQRTDLNAGTKPLAITHPVSDSYGQAKQLEGAQRTVPMGTTAVQPQQPQANTPPPQPPGPPPVMPTPLNAPSEQPNIPVTHGAPSGPGAGPEALVNTGIDTSRMSNMLAAIARQSGSNAMATLAQRAQSLGQ